MEIPDMLNIGRVWKFPIEGYGRVLVKDIPAGSMLLKVGNQGGRLMAWFDVIPGNRTVSWVFSLVMTGGDIDPDMGGNYIDTVFFNKDETFVVHVFGYELG